MHPSITRGRPMWPVSHCRPDLAVLVTDDGSRTLICAESGNTFHSVSGAFRETEHTYLTNSGVLERFQNQTPANVLEIGFGTGLGMYLTVDHAIKNQAKLKYVSLEHDFLGADVLAELGFGKYLNQPSIFESFIEFRSGISDSCLKAESDSSEASFTWFPDPDADVSVEIHVSDVTRWVEKNESERFDAIYFDPFCRNSAPELWQSEMFQQLAPLLSESGRLVTYSCAKAVRDAVSQAGLLPRRVPGPPKGKREALVAAVRDES